MGGARTAIVTLCKWEKSPATENLEFTRRSKLVLVDLLKNLATWRWIKKNVSLADSISLRLLASRPMKYSKSFLHCAMARPIDHIRYKVPRLHTCVDSDSIEGKPFFGVWVLHFRVVLLSDRRWDEHFGCLLVWLSTTLLCHPRLEWGFSLAHMFSNSSSVCSRCLCLGSNLNFQPNDKTSFWALGFTGKCGSFFGFANPWTLFTISRT